MKKFALFVWAWGCLLMMPSHASIRWQQSGDPLHKQYQLSQQGELVYQTRFVRYQDKLVQEVLSGHPSQLGVLELMQNQVVAYQPDGTISWQDELQQPLCLPELFGEFIRLHRTVLLAGTTVHCEGPILKAAKLAPFQLMLQQQTADRLTFVVKPGSFGMWFFMNPIYLETDRQVQRIFRYQGVWPAPVGRDGKMQYLTTDWSDPQGMLITDFVHPAMQHRVKP
jgi:hypothetical protein